MFTKKRELGGLASGNVIEVWPELSADYKQIEPLGTQIDDDLKLL